MSKSTEWETPQGLFDRLDKEFHFTLDPCATPENAKCKKFFTVEDNGLAQIWAREVVFMNPPYGREIGDWAEKAHWESLYWGATVVCLVPASTDTEYWHEHFMQAQEIRFIKGRLHFNDEGRRAPFPSAVVIFRPEGKAIRLRVRTMLAHDRRG